jgi:serine/threonine-protein kinase
MSPEQLQGKQIDGRSDVYSLGAVIYHMLTGQQLFQGENLFEFFHQHINEAPKSISEARPDLYFPVALQTVVFKCLRKDPSERFTDFLTLKEALLDADTITCRSAFNCRKLSCDIVQRHVERCG